MSLTPEEWDTHSTGQAQELGKRGRFAKVSHCIYIKTDAIPANCSNKLIFGICLINNGIELQKQAHSPQLSAGLASEY